MQFRTLIDPMLFYSKDGYKGNFKRYKKKVKHKEYGYTTYFLNSFSIRPLYLLIGF